MKRWFAKDRWQVVRVTQWSYDRESVSYTKIQIRNKYSGKIKLVRKEGEWTVRDFPDGIFRG